MNAALTTALLRGGLGAQRGRNALGVLCIALGVALAGAVHTLHASALAEIDGAARTLAGSADVEIRGPRNGFDDALFEVIARRPEVRVASPVLELEAAQALAPGTLRVLGIDPFRAMRLQPAIVAGPTGPGDAAGRLDARSAWLTPSAAARLKARPGDALRVLSGVREVELRVAGVLPALDGAGETAVLDIAAVQDLFDRVGRLSRIDVRLREGVSAADFRSAIAPLLPAGVVASTSASIAGRAATLSRAYRVNLNALALVALVTGLFLVFSTLALQAARRRREFALLRALGVTRTELATLLGAEGALLGAAGAALGTALGLAAAFALLRYTGPETGAGYFRGGDGLFAPDALALGAIALAGVASAAAGALLVARQVARLDVAEALRDRDLDLPGGNSRAGARALALVAAGAALLAAPPVSGLPLGGYAAIGLWLAASVLLVGPACRVLLGGARADTRPVAALALAQVRHLPGHLAASVSGIVVSVSLCVAMAIMVHSFRTSLDEWLQGVIGADLYARPAAAGDTGYFSPEEQRVVAGLPGIARLEAIRYDRLVIANAGAADDAAPPVTLIARPLDPRVLRGFQANPVDAPPGEAIAVWISEAAMDLQGWRTGQALSLPIAGRAVPVVVAGTFRDYARVWGAVLVDLGDYRRVTGDARANDLALHLAPGTRPAAAIAAIERALPGARGIAFEDASGIHARSLEIFDRTFAATYALEAVAIAIALAGVTSSFAALAWSRRREFGVLRHLGLARRDVLRLLALEGTATGAIGALMGLASGAAISFILVHVVNRQSFHWGMEVHWPVAALAMLLAAVVALCALGARWSGAAAVRDDAILAVKDDA